MARCKYCGVEGLEWVNQCNAGWRLRDDDDFLHQCEPADVLKEQRRSMQEDVARLQALQKHRESNGYL